MWIALLKSAYLNCLGSKFQLKLTILIFWTKFAHKGFQIQVTFTQGYSMFSEYHGRNITFTAFFRILRYHYYFNVSSPKGRRVSKQICISLTRVKLYENNYVSKKYTHLTSLKVYSVSPKSYAVYHHRNFFFFDAILTTTNIESSKDLIELLFELMHTFLNL